MKNSAFRSLQSVHADLEKTLANEWMDNDDGTGLDWALAEAPNTSSLRVLHPLFFQQWREPRRSISKEPIEIVGLDVETQANTGEPRLLGYWYPKVNKYYCDDKPSLERFADVVRAIRDNSHAQLCVWGRLDIQIVMRLFNPTEKERVRISRGIGGKVTHGEISVNPPCLRVLEDETQFFIAQYIPGRALKLGWIEHKESGQPMSQSIWIYNCSQFYPGTIRQTARGMGIPWIDFDKKTHIVDWSFYLESPEYQQSVQNSNKQDARVVTELALRLQEDFASILDGVYPKQLISPGSLTDAAVSSMLSDGDYKATSWIWLRRNCWGNCANAVTQCETLLAEAFSAGYVDQFAIGYFDCVCTADIAAAYPHKIRALPDLRYATLVYGRNNLDDDIDTIGKTGFDIETAVIRGRVHVPDYLVFHPITIRNSKRQNYRPIGDFRAAYTLEERDFCRRFGATFEKEEYCIIALQKRTPSPLAKVSEALGSMRADLLSRMKTVEKDTDEYRTLDARQYVVKVVDNSLYGKTTMTLECVEEIDNSPAIVGYTTGDRYNPLYATLITARTRVQLSDACMQIVLNGGIPVMNMTDSVYWDGTTDMLPPDYWRETKTVGYFEKPEIVYEFFILKTGQYEYQKGECKHCEQIPQHPHKKYVHKLRGLPVPFERIQSDGLFLRAIVQTIDLDDRDARDVRISIPTRRLCTIGNTDLDLLGCVMDGETELRPFALSGKSGQFEYDWHRCIDGCIFIPPLTAPRQNSVPYALLRKLYEAGVKEQTQTDRERHLEYNRTLRTRKRDYARAHNITDIPRTGDANWAYLRYRGEGKSET